MRFKVVAALLLGALSSAATAAETIVMLRHAEKNPSGLGQLSCQGFNRSLALPGVLLSRFGTPSAIYAPNPGVRKKDMVMEYNYLRPLATIEPTAVAAGVPVNTQFGYEDTGLLSAALLNKQNQNATIFVTWEHKAIERVAKSLIQKLGGDIADVPIWMGADYDSLYILKIGDWIAGTREITFHIEKQELDDQSTTCGFYRDEKEPDIEFKDEPVITPINPALMI